MDWLAFVCIGLALILGGPGAAVIMVACLFVAWAYGKMRE